MNKVTKAFKDINRAVKEALTDMVNETETNEDSKPATIEYKLDSGETVNIEGELENGSIVTNKEGSVYPDGAYHLEDQSLLRVEGGIITEYVKHDPEKDKDTVQKKDSDTATDIDKSNSNKVDAESEKINSELKVQITELEKQVKEISEILHSQLTINSEIKKQIELIGNQPGDKPLTPNDQAEDFSKLTLAQKLARTTNKK